MATARRTLTDPRLFVGVALVAASVVGVVALVAAADRTTGAYAAPALLLPGDRVTADDLDVVPVRLAGAADGYLAEGDLPAEGVVVTRVVAPGELLPLAAVGAAEEGAASAVVVPLQAPLPASMEPGRAVDVWAAPALAAGAVGEPVLIADGAVLIGASGESGALLGDAGSVEVLVPREHIPAVLDAVANAESIALVGAAGPAPDASASAPESSSTDATGTEGSDSESTSEDSSGDSSANDPRRADGSGGGGSGGGKSGGGGSGDRGERRG